MKHLLTLTFLSIIGLTHAQIPSFIPSTGLVGWWPFNGNANDESGNGNNGTVNGAALTVDRNGFANSAYNFNVNNWAFGSGGDNIYIPYNSIFNFSDFTISTWVKRTSVGSLISPQGLTIIRRYQYGYSNPNGEAWVMQLAHGTSSTGSVLIGAVIQQAPSPAPALTAQSIQTVSLNQWYNITMTYSQSTINLYIDNQLVGTAFNPNININTVGNSGISIGLSEQANGQWAPFDGSIDDIGIWNRALTEAEILALYEGCQLAITTQPQDQSVATSVGTASFSAASSSVNATYQWQTNLGLGYQNVSNAGQYTGATSAALTVSNLSLSNNNQVFRCIVNDSACADTTADATLTIIDDAGIHLISEALIGVYPNPVQDILYVKGITSKEFEYEVLSIDGKLLQKGKSQGEISVKDLRKGNYVLRIGLEQVSFVKQ